MQGTCNVPLRNPKLETVFEMTPNEALIEYRSYLKLRNYRPDTIINYTAMLRPFWAWLLKEAIEDLRSVSRKMLDVYAAQVTSAPVSRSTQSLRIRAVKHLFGCLVEHNHLLVDPAVGLKEPSIGSRLPRPILTHEEMKRLLAQPNVSLTRGIRDRALLELLYATGLRIREVVLLTVYDLDLEAGLLKIRSGKGGKGRVVPVGKEATKWLKEYLTKIRPRQNRLAPQERSLFLTQYGTGFNRHTVKIILQRYSKLAKIKKSVTCHTIRHTVASHLLEAGANIVVIRELLGHQRISTTQVYTRVRPVDIKAMHQKTHSREA